MSPALKLNQVPGIHSCIFSDFFCPDIDPRKRLALDSWCRQCNLFELPLVSAKAYGKPPPESLNRINETKAFDFVGSHDSRGKKTLLLADGAKCYVPLARKHDLLLRQCNHSKGQFSHWKWLRGRGHVRVHTGGIDSYWTLMKNGVPNSLASHTKGQRNRMLWKYIRSQQWRWEQTGKDLFYVTGKAVARLWVPRVEKRWPHETQWTISHRLSP